MSPKRKYFQYGKYEMRAADYQLMMAEQNSCCAICKKSTKERLHIDHDHKTGNIRGLVCMQCNTLLGKAYDNPEILRAAIKYLENNGHPSRFHVEGGRLLSSY